MPLEAPKLDDRKFADIVTEAKTLIPRYAPEWTNFNESDPGITLMELFAWMTDIVVYRLNQVPDLNYIKFLQLIGIELKAAQPARVPLTFTMSRQDVSSVIVPKGTQVAAQGAAGTPIVFELDEALTAIGAQLAAVQTFDGFGYSAQTSKNAVNNQWFYPFGQNPKYGNALLLGFSSTVDFPTDQIDLAFNLYVDGLTPPLMKCGAAIPPPATIVWEYWDGGQWEFLDIDSDGTRAFTQDGHVMFVGPGNLAVKSAMGNVKDLLYWLRARLENATYERSPKLAAIRTNTGWATQAITFQDEVLGGSDGTPNQTFQVANTPVVVRDAALKITTFDGVNVTVPSLQLEINEGQGFMAWQQVGDFFSSGPDERVFMFDVNTGLVQLGNGDHGHIPVVNQTDPSQSVVARNYRAGGGVAGNLAAKTVTQLQTYVESISEVSNFDAATGGTEEETLENAKVRAGLALKSNDRAVTVEDFEYAATQAPGANVKRALALPLFHPNFPNGQIPGVVTVVVVPDSPSPNPTPNQATLSAVCAYLDKHRLLTSEIYVVGPVYRKIKVQVQLVVDPGADLASVKNNVQAALANFFDPLKGGKDKTGWPFGGTIYYTDVYRAIFQTDGVLRIQDNQLLLWLDDQMQTFCRDVAINAGELLYNDPQGHVVEVSYGT